MIGSLIDWSHPLAAGTAGWWTFGEGSGNRLFDISLNQNHGDLQNMAPETSWLPSTHPRFTGNTLSFDGLNDRVNIPAPDDGSLALTNWTLSVIYRRDVSVGDSSFDEVLVSRGRFNDPGINYVFGSYDSAEVLYAGFENASGVNRFFNSSATILVGVWYHVVYTKQGADNIIYIDGLLDNSTTFTDDVVTALATASEFVRIGEDLFGRDPIQGPILDVHIFDHALSASEVWNLFENPWAAVVQSRITYFAPVVAGGTILPQVVSAYYRINA